MGAGLRPVFLNMSKNSETAERGRLALCMAGAAASMAMQGCASSSQEQSAPVEFRSGGQFQVAEENYETGFHGATDSWDTNFESNGGHLAGQHYVSSNLGIQPSERGESIIVQKGDTLYGISRRYRVSLEALIATNNAVPPYTIKIGETVWLPPPNIHIVSEGETLESISERFNVDYRSLAVLNQLPRPYDVHPGDQIRLPGLARDFGEFNVAVKAPQPEGAEPGLIAYKAPTEKLHGVSQSEPVAASQQAESIPSTIVPSAIPRRGTVSSAGFSWPLDGQLLQGFGEQPGGVKNEGLNIAAPSGAPIFAAADGQVVYAGADLADFGNLLLIAHDNGWVTAYAHASQINVSIGQQVSRGQPVAQVGVSGAVGDPQLHFQIRQQKTPKDPASLLPPVGA